MEICPIMEMETLLFVYIFLTSFPFRHFPRLQEKKLIIVSKNIFHRHEIYVDTCDSTKVKRNDA